MAAPLRILVTGGTGQVGGALLQTLAPLGEVVAPTRTGLDLTDPASIRALMRELQPRWVVNPAAYTAVDKAESEPALAHAINATAPAVFAEEAARIGAVLLHFSTDYVFDGTKSTPYVETDPTAPLGVYGSTKLAGEQALAASAASHLVFRTSWVYGATGRNFLLTILKLARERDRLRIVGDQHGAPTWSFDLARMTAHVIARFEALAAHTGSSLAEIARPASGIYHAGGAGETTWYGFAAQAVAELQAREPATKLATVEPIPTAEYPTPARRPANSRLDCTKLAEALDWRMMDWRESLKQVFTELGR
jgi:dTDP-4-dehydrorhamnose reductase